MGGLFFFFVVLSVTRRARAKWFPFFFSLSLLLFCNMMDSVRWLYAAAAAGQQQPYQARSHRHWQSTGGRKRGEDEIILFVHSMLFYIWKKEKKKKKKGGKKIIELFQFALRGPTHTQKDDDRWKDNLKWHTTMLLLHRVLRKSN